MDGLLWTILAKNGWWLGLPPWRFGILHLTKYADLNIKKSGFVSNYCCLQIQEQLGFSHQRGGFNHHKSGKDDLTISNQHTNIRVHDTIWHPCVLGQESTISGKEILVQASIDRPSGAPLWNVLLYWCFLWQTIISRSNLVNRRWMASIHIASMYGIYIYICANIWGILMVNVTIYTIHGCYGLF